LEKLWPADLAHVLLLTALGRSKLRRQSRRSPRSWLPPSPGAGQQAGRAPSLSGFAAWTSPTPRCGLRARPRLAINIWRLIILWS